LVEPPLEEPNRIDPLGSEDILRHASDPNILRDHYYPLAKLSHIFVFQFSGSHLELAQYFIPVCVKDINFTHLSLELNCEPSLDEGDVLIHFSKFEQHQLSYHYWL
jgi:hypothetical protein